MTDRMAFGATAFALIALFSASHPVLDPDMWWHLAVGEAIWHNRSVQFVDPLSFTNAQVWVNSQWLSEVIFFKVSEFLGLRRLEFFAMLIKVATFLIVFASMRSKPLTKVWLTILFAFVAFPVLGGARPQLFSFLFIALLALKIHKQRQLAIDGNETQRSNFAGLSDALFLPLLFALWANIHSFYPLAFALLVIAVFADWANERMGLQAAMGSVWRRKMAIAIVFCGLAVTITPFGWHSAKQVIVNIVQSSQLPIEEWKPAMQMRHPLVFIWALLLLLWLVCLAWSPKRPDALEIFWGLFVTFNALMGVRMVALWCLIVAPFFCEHISQWLSQSKIFNRQTEGLKWLPTSTVVLLAFLAGLILALKFSQNEFQKMEQKEYPKGAVAWLMERNLKGNCLTRYDWGGYVAWRTKGQIKVFVDGRADFYPLKVMRDFIALYYGRANWEQVLNRYGVNIVLVPPDAPVANLLTLKTGDWRIAYRDKVAVIFLRRALAFSERALLWRHQRVISRKATMPLQTSKVR
ncbi:MAG: hypothetical protein NZ805_01505 [Armatimonadetes bacterium]|nr:hypothetical protein [Armatimonadota bacterium]MDW8027587.1 hypothetical protein [Armatimonadota bacterium]